MFEGIRGNSYTGDIALDDISFTVGAGSCTLQPYDALPPGMTTAAPTTSTPTNIGNYVMLICFTYVDDMIMFWIFSKKKEKEGWSGQSKYCLENF